MPRALLLKNGFVFSERENLITLHPRYEGQCWIVTFINGGETVEIRSEDVYHLFSMNDRNQLPRSTYSLQSSSHANSQPVTISPTANTLTTQPHVLACLRELLASLEMQVRSMRKLLAVLSTE